MHEYSIVRALLRKVEAEARRHGAARVDRVRLQIGEMSGVEVDLLETAFELARPRTICAAAQLEVTRVPVRWACRSCEAEIPSPGRLVCGACGGPARLVSGDEIILERLEMEVA